MKHSSGNAYPPQTGSYAVKVKRGAGWREFDTARFHISVGQPYHEGEKFRATMAWAKHRFNHIIVCVNDTLQRHNLEFDGIEPTAALDLAQLQGTEWIRRNQSAMIGLPSCALHRWEEWRSQPEYAAEHAHVTALYQSNQHIKRAIDDDVMAFWQRRCRKSELSEQHRLGAFQHHATRYLIEECAVFSMMFKRDRAVDVYPGSTLLPCVLFKNEEALGAQSFTRIDFSRRNEHAPLPKNQFG